MKFTPTILNIYSLVFLVACIGFTIYNYDELSGNGGWGMVGMVGLFGFGVSLFVGDMIIRKIFPNKIITNLIGFLVSIVATLLVLYGGFF
jgi:hypothetical protein